MDRAPLKFEPLARRILTGSGKVNLSVYSYLGEEEIGATAQWLVVTDDDYGTGSGITDADGHVELTGVPAATASNGEIAVYLDSPDQGAYDLMNLSWGDTGWSGALQPGRLPVTIVRSGQSGWYDWAARVWLWAENAGGEAHLARMDIAQTGVTTPGYARTITTGPESLTGGGALLLGQPGHRAAGRRHRGVFGAGGRPGTDRVPGPGPAGVDGRLGLGQARHPYLARPDNYPSGWVNSIGGVAGWPSSATPKDFGSFTTTGSADDDWKRVTIPSGAAPGYAYYV